MNTKICRKCGQEKRVEDFYNQPKNRDGKTSYCCSCYSVMNRKHYHADRSYVLRLKRNFDLSWNDYLNKAKEQHNLCAICGQPETTVYRKTGRPKLLSVDHNHRTGQIRDLLCSRCNTALGLLDENPERIQKILDYLKKFGEQK